MNNNVVKMNLVTKLTTLLNTVSKLSISSFIKLKILKLYMVSQFVFDLKVCDLPATWIEQNLDSLVINSVRNWMSLPVSSCVAEFAYIPKRLGGLGLVSFKDLNQKLQLKNRNYLKNSTNTSLNELWKLTAVNNINTDEKLVNSKDLSPVLKSLELNQILEKCNHLESLSLQGLIFTSVTKFLTNCEISRWSHAIEAIPDIHFKFTRKAFAQQLATNANLKRWRKTNSDLCNLCNACQSNKHVLSNCSSPVALQRYLFRHNAILTVLAEWLSQALDKSVFTLCVDLDNTNFNPVGAVFQTLRPDIVVFSSRSVFILELTICHETNLESASQRKSSKYSNLQEDLKSQFSSCHFLKFYLQISTLGFISDFTEFCRNCKIKLLTTEVKNKITSIAIAQSYDIYCKRNALS